MVNLNCSHFDLDESLGGEKLDKYNDLIWTMKAADYMNEENQENLNRVHVLCCVKCDFLTISLTVLQQHMLLLHSVPTEDFNNLTIYYCQECKCVSTELKLIYEHIKIFHQISAENSSNSSTSGIVHRKAKILTPSVIRNSRKTTHGKMIKTQQKIRQHILKQKGMKMKTNNILSTDIDIAEKKKSFTPVKDREVKKETMPHNVRTEMSQAVDENDPLDMSINSTTCPFKAIKLDGAEGSEFSNFAKLEPELHEDYDDSWKNNNILLSNPQTCIELIKLTLSQMLNKTTEQSHLSHVGFSPSPYLTQQFPLPSNIVPLLLPTSNDGPFVSKNPNIEAILANIQQQNHCKIVSTKAFEQNNQMISFQQSPLFLHHKLSNAPKSPFSDGPAKNGSLTISPLSAYTPKKFALTSTKRNLKKQTLPTKVRSSFNDEPTKCDPTSSEELFNRSFLDSIEPETVNDKVDTEGHDQLETLTMHSDKSSPNTMSNDKPHRQNFTSQQNRILSDWFFTHCDKPYPSTEDTKELSQLSGLTYSQVKKWFANKRARSSLNKKNHKNYCMISPLEGMANDDLVSVSPSSDSHKSYLSPSDVPLIVNFPSSTPNDLVHKN